MGSVHPMKLHETCIFITRLSGIRDSHWSVMALYVKYVVLNCINGTLIYIYIFFVFYIEQCVYGCAIFLHFVYMLF